MKFPALMVACASVIPLFGGGGGRIARRPESRGVGYYGTPSAIKYNWLLDDGAGHLVHGPPVLVSTPVFAYYPPAPGVLPQVQAQVEPPQIEVEPVEGFGPAAWVKSIKTSSHTNRPIELRNLMSDDPNHPDDKTWRNGLESEVEAEFELVQQEFGSGGRSAGRDSIGCDSNDCNAGERAPCAKRRSQPVKSRSRHN